MKTLTEILGKDVMKLRNDYRIELETKLLYHGVDIQKLNSFNNRILELELLDKVNGKGWRNK